MSYLVYDRNGAYRASVDSEQEARRLADKLDGTWVGCEQPTKYTVTFVHCDAADRCPQTCTLEANTLQALYQWLWTTRQKLRADGRRMPRITAQDIKQV